MLDKTNHIKYIGNQLICGEYRHTYQRDQIIEIMYETNRLMNVDEIYNKVKSRYVGLSTIYRNLIILEEARILKRINIINTNYYELEKIGKNKFHIHAECVKCNKLIDISEEEISENLKDLTKALNKKLKITSISSSVVLSGICKECE